MEDIRWQQRFQNFQKAFQYELVDDGEVWMDMLEKRNLMAHAYDETRAEASLSLIRVSYAQQFQRLHALFLLRMK